MFKIKFIVFVSIFLLGAALFADGSQWSKEAQKLETSIKTLNTLLSINPFPADVPGLNTAITNKTEQLISNLGALDSALQSELSLLSADERQEALSTQASLLVQIADIGEMLVLRSFDQLTLTLVGNYNSSYTSYYSLAGQYSLTTKALPIGTTVNDRGGWIPA